VAWVSVSTSFLTYILTPLFFIVPPQRHRASRYGTAADGRRA